MAFFHPKSLIFLEEADEFFSSFLSVTKLIIPVIISVIPTNFVEEKRPSRVSLKNNPTTTAGIVPIPINIGSSEL